jgi:hypothetical protein
MSHGRTDPPGVALGLRVVARQTSYKLELQGRSGAEFRQLLEQLQEQSARGLAPVEYPEPPKVDLDVEISNTGEELLQVLLGGTVHSIRVELAGPGAVNFTPREPIPAMLCPPATIPLAVGARYVVAMPRLPLPILPALSFGRSFSYWTEPGRYTLTAFWTAGVSPPPAGSRDDGTGFGHVTVISEPVAVQVV